MVDLFTLTALPPRVIIDSLVTAKLTLVILPIFARRVV